MRAADEAILLVDPRRDTGDCNSLLLLGLGNVLKMIIRSIYLYCCSNPIVILCAYLCCFIFFGIYTIGFCNLLNNVHQTAPQHKNSCRNQNGRWKYHPQGVKRTKRINGWQLRRDEARRKNFWERYGHSGVRRTSKVKTWASEHQWQPILDPDYSSTFSHNCARYKHYFEATRGKLGIHSDDKPFGTLASDTKHHHCAHCFTALEDDLFAPSGFYIANGDKPIVFDSGCSIAVTPHLEDFGGEIKKVQKTMTGLSSTAQVEGEGMVNWSFYDDYGVIQHVKVKANYIPSSTVRLFSP